MKRVIGPNDTSLVALVEKSIKANWDRPAYSNYGTDERYTYEDVAKMIARLHQLFRQLGIQPGQRIAVCDKNSANWAVAFLASFTYGAVSVPILAEFSIEQIQNIYDHSESVLIICGKKYANSLNARTLCISDFKMCDGSLGIDMDAFCDLRPEQVSYFRENPDDLMLLSYTSGSTGRSKGVMLPYRSISANMAFADEVLVFGRGDKTLAILPLAHMYGFSFDLFIEFLTGCHVHFLAKVPSPRVVVQAFSEIRPVMVIAVPLILEKIVQKQVFPMLRTHKMRALMAVPGLKSVVYRLIRKKLYMALGGNFYECVVGGAGFNKEVEEFLHNIHFPYTVGYGMTECGPLLGYEDWKKFAQGSCGKAVTNITLRIDSADPQNVPGEILAKGPCVMLGYYKNEEETREAIDADGWLHTGDLGTIDAEGNVFIRGRKKTMLLGPNGQNVYPEEVETVIINHTIFDECVLVQRKDKLVALVYASDQTLTEAGLTRETLRDQLPQFKRMVNSKLPSFSNIYALEARDEAFEKTPKHSIRRHLYS